MAKVVYILYWKREVEKGEENRAIACSNKRVLAERGPLKYDNIVRIFTRQRKFFWEDLEHVIIKIYEKDIIRGNQKLSKRGMGIRFKNGNY